MFFDSVSIILAPGQIFKIVSQGFCLQGSFFKWCLKDSGSWAVFFKIVSEESWLLGSFVK